MTALTNQAPKDSYGDLLQVSNSNNGIDGTRRFVSDGKATNSTLKLSSTGAEFVSGQVLLPDGSTSACAIAFSTQTNTGMYLDTANNGIAFAVQGTEVLRLFATNQIISTVEIRTENGPKLTKTAPTGTSPSVQPDKDDSDTGLGRNAEDELSAIAGGKEVFRYATDTTAVNTFKATASPTGSPLTLEAVGTDTNIGVKMLPKGTGGVQHPDGTAGAPAMTFSSDTSAGFYRIGADNVGLALAGAKVADFSTTTVNMASGVLLQHDGKTLTEEIIASGEISTTTAEVVVTNLSTTYRAFALYVSNLVPETDAKSFGMQTSANNGSSYDSAAGNYKWEHVRVKSGGTVTGAGDTTAATFIQCTPLCGNAAGEQAAGRIIVSDPAHSGSRASAVFNFKSMDNAGVMFTNTGGGERTSNQAVDAVRFAFDGSNIASMRYTFVGIRAS